MPKLHRQDCNQSQAETDQLSPIKAMKGLSTVATKSTKKTAIPKAGVYVNMIHLRVN